MPQPLIKAALGALLIVAASYLHAYEDSTAEDIDYLFGWPFVDLTNMAPRGGTTTGPMPETVNQPTESWNNLQTDGLSKKERDRSAILAMAGAYRTSFEFLETIGFTPDFSPAQPYRSWATEYVYVIADESDFISLQHILVMVLEQEDGSLSDPMVTKHWRQDWRFQDTDLHEYVGNGLWQRTSPAADEVAGTWSQAVFQVDDSPRYESVGEWRHYPTHSVWEGHETRRPLPRREFSVRDDYDLLLGTNRHTILPTGWTHEQDNLKTVINEKGALDPVTPFVARETGVNRYERITGFDFSAGDRYWELTAPYWQMVRSKWAETFSAWDSVKFEATIDGQSMVMAVFGKAMQMTDSADFDADKVRAEIDRLFDQHVTGLDPAD